MTAYDAQGRKWWDYHELWISIILWDGPKLHIYQCKQLQPADNLSSNSVIADVLGRMWILSLWREHLNKYLYIRNSWLWHPCTNISQGGSNRRPNIIPPESYIIPQKSKYLNFKCLLNINVNLMLGQFLTNFVFFWRLTSTYLIVVVP